MLIEEWDSKEAMNAHIRSRDFRVVLSVIDLSSETPSIHFDTVQAREGLDLLTQVFATS